jgi:hypothetical protein
MSLASGLPLGPYETVAPIGAGGMGEVYRARDTRPKRDVALKVLPETFAADPDRLRRFEHEAQVLAALNHPNIAAIYGFEQADGVAALVLELVEGPTPVGESSTFATSVWTSLASSKTFATRSSRFSLQTAHGLASTREASCGAWTSRPAGPMLCAPSQMAFMAARGRRTVPRSFEDLDGPHSVWTFEPSSGRLATGHRKRQPQPDLVLRWLEGRLQRRAR